MELKKVSFIGSYVDSHKIPNEIAPRYAVIGRSNVGKSTFINMLANNSKLAKTSAKPGKTQTINVFHCNDEWFLDDLPGYGYTKTSKKHRLELTKILESYLLSMKSLVCLFVLIDVRHSPQYSDLQFMKWITLNEIPYAIIFTKIDKLSKQQLSKQITNYQKELHNYWEPLPPFFKVSSLKHTGKSIILDYISRINNKVDKHS